MTPGQQPLTKHDLREALDTALQPVITRLDATDARLDSAVQTLSARLDATDARLDSAVQTLSARLDATEARLIGRQEAIIEGFAHNLTDLRRELMEQLERLQNRTERTDINLSGLMMQIAGMSKSLSVLERSEGQTNATQNAQQRAIDDLYAQIAELKRRLLPPQ